MEQAVSSIRLLDQFAEKYGVEVGDVFKYIPPSEIIRLVELGKLSAWLLLFSRKFAEWHSTLGEEQQLIVEDQLRDDNWEENKRAHQADIIKVKQLIREFGL
jgi:hypothetical protein